MKEKEVIFFEWETKAFIKASGIVALHRFYGYFLDS